MDEVTNGVTTTTTTAAGAAAGAKKGGGSRRKSASAAVVVNGKVHALLYFVGWTSARGRAVCV